MKKYRVTTNTLATISLFESPEALYLWSQFKAPGNPKGAVAVELRVGDYVDVEWMGCEFIQESADVYKCLNMVRADVAKRADNEAGHVVSSFIGWVSSDTLTLCEGEHENVTVRLLNES